MHFKYIKCYCQNLGWTAQIWPNAGGGGGEKERNTQTISQVPRVMARFVWNDISYFWIITKHKRVSFTAYFITFQAFTKVAES